MLPTEWERKVPQGMAPGFIGATSGGEKMGRAGHLSPGNKTPGCSQAVGLPLFSAYTLQYLTVIPTPPLGFFPQSFWFDVAECEV